MDETLLNGVLCFMLFAGSTNVKIRVLGEEKWVILTFAIGATLLGAFLVGLGITWSLGLVGIGIGLIFALVFGALKADRLGLTNLLTWGGLRGGLAIAMAMSLPDSPEKTLILHMTYGVVAFSIVIQGLTISRFFMLCAASAIRGIEISYQLIDGRIIRH